MPRHESEDPPAIRATNSTASSTPPVRFSIAAALAEADFGTVRDAVEITGSALSKQVPVLEEAE